MMARYIPVLPGEKYGCYTVLERTDKSENQEFYKVQCDCGNVSVIGKSRLRTNPTRCKKCAGRAYSEMMHDKREGYVGQIMNGLRILEIVPNESTPGKTAKFLTECVNCGAKSIKTLDAIKGKKNERCKFCPPDYRFEVIGDTAIGRLPDGTKFKIDVENIDFVSRYHWYVNGGGYLFRRDSETREPIRMHRIILGLSQNDGWVVDHLNHDKLDNRKCNLSVATQSENCLNNIKKCTNTLGHVGIHISKDGGLFTGRISKNGKEYVLLTTQSIEDAAQAYNVAADYLFGVGVGYRNMVLYPSQQFACSIVEKIKEMQKQEIS